jgi:putative acetyltransferase
MTIVIRQIEKSDNPVIAKIIRDTLAEFGANQPGTVYFDPTTDQLYELFLTPRSAYNVLLMDGEIMGGAGIFPTDGLPDDTCELVKLYLRKEARGRGLGKRLIQVCTDQARQWGFRRIYLETMNELGQALKTYEQSGFTYLDAPMGNSGHFGCPIWMVKRV